MGRVIGVLALGAAVVACEPRPTELYIPREGNDWILILSEAREQLIHRTGDIFQSSQVPEPFSSESLAMDSIALTEADGVGLVSRFGDSSVLAFDGFTIRENRVAPKLEVVSAARASQARCRCSAPQSSDRALVVAGSACALPQPKETYEFAAGPGSFTDRNPAVEASAQRFLLESSIDGECDVFLGTERLVGEQARPPLRWERVVGLPKAERLEGICLAAGADDLLAVGQDRLHYQARAETEWVSGEPLSAGTCLAMASLRDPTGDLSFWSLVAAPNLGGAGLGVVQLERPPADSSPEGFSDVVPIAGLNSVVELWNRASPTTILAREPGGDVVLYEPASWHPGEEPLEPRPLPEQTGTEPQVLLGGSASTSVLVTTAGSSTWLAWGGEDGLGLAWVLPVIGREGATLYTPAGPSPGVLRHAVALDEDRVVLIFRTQFGDEAWEWLQPPLEAAHPYDQTCERAAGTFCFRPFPTTERLDGRIPCETSAEIAHAWAEPRGLAVVYEDGHTWRSGSPCEPQPGLAPVRGASTDGGRTLLLDDAGDFWLAKEDP